MYMRNNFGEYRESADLEKAADALRRHEQAGKKLNEWQSISRAQKRRWINKVVVVLNAICDVVYIEGTS